ncbi:NUDIX hydrolase [Fluviispira vulneris]|uniref:NUDIX hydrolase n=1 Tax=Fluviispira vulneris TaxID=2763012 RepID=UPI0016473C03|nr:NUDIX hydrolase [Fluviispira vulneris]
MKLLLSLLLILFALTGCSNSTIKNHSGIDNKFTAITYDGEDDLFERTDARSPFARPSNARVGFDVDGVLHTEVRYSLEDKYFPLKFVFDTTKRNLRLQKEIKFLLNHSNKPYIVTHNKDVCDSRHTSNSLNFLNTNKLDSIRSSDIFCVSKEISAKLKNQNINVFYDDSPSVLSEIAKNSPATKLFMVLPKHQKIAHYFEDPTPSNKFIANCGVLIVDDSSPKKRFLLQLRSDKLGGWWNFPGGSCAYKENKSKNCAIENCEDPISGAIREFNEESGKEHLFEKDLDKAKRFMVLRSKEYMLFVVKFDKNYISSRSFIPQDKYAWEVSDMVFNISDSPGYRWFDLDECKIGAKVQGYNLSHTGRTCEIFRNYLEQF